MKVSSPSVSVVIPTFNDRRTLSRAVASILQQELRDLECIVVDDGSSDDVEEVLSEYASDVRLRYFRLGSNRGRGAARNFGLSVARGGLVAWQDADDCSLPLRVEAQAAYLAAHPDVAMVGTGAFVELGAGNIRVANCTNIAASRLGGGCDPPLFFPSLMIRREVFRTVRFRESLRVAEDYDFLVRAMRSWCYANIGKPLYVYDATGQADLAKYAMSQQVRMAVLFREAARDRPLKVAGRLAGIAGRVVVYAGSGLVGARAALVNRRYAWCPPEERAAYCHSTAGLPRVAPLEDD